MQTPRIISAQATMPAEKFNLAWNWFARSWIGPTRSELPSKPENFRAASGAHLVTRPLYSQSASGTQRSFGTGTPLDKRRGPPGKPSSSNCLSEIAEDHQLRKLLPSLYLESKFLLTLIIESFTCKHDSLSKDYAGKLVSDGRAKKGSAPAKLQISPREQLRFGAGRS